MVHGPDGYDIGGLIIISVSFLPGLGESGGECAYITGLYQRRCCQIAKRGVDGTTVGAGVDLGAADVQGERCVRDVVDGKAGVFDVSSFYLCP